MKRVALLLGLGLVTGCAGGRTWIVAPSASYPVSISEGMRGPDGHLLAAREMEVVGKFHSDHTGWSLLYSGVPLTPHTNISEEVNGQVAAARGEAVVRLSTSSKPCAADYFVLLTIIPFWPGCANVSLDGDIIRYRSTSAASPAGAVPVAVEPARPEVRFADRPRADPR